MFEKVLSKNAKESLGLLGKTSILKNAYLAGGTAAALQLGHRESNDLDFFSGKKFSEKDLLKKLQKNLPGFKLEKITQGTIISYFADADEEKMPKLFQSISWKEIKRFLEREVRYLSRRLLL